MATNVKTSKDSRKAYRYYVITSSYRYYFKRKADANRLSHIRDKQMEIIFNVCLSHFNEFSKKYVRMVDKLNTSDKRAFEYVANQIVILAHHRCIAKDYEKQVHGLISAMIQVSTTIQCKRVLKELQKQYDVIFSAPQSFFHVSPYIVVPL